MITKQEYLAALGLISAYQLQVKQAHEESTKLLNEISQNLKTIEKNKIPEYDPFTKLADTNCGIRLWNMIVYNKRMGAEVTLQQISTYPESYFKIIRGFGGKALEELKKILSYAGLTLVSE